MGLLGERRPAAAGRRLALLAQHGRSRRLEFIAAGRVLRPWSRRHLRAARQPGGDIKISWVRRARWGGDSWERMDPMISERVEIYKISII